MNKVLFKIIKSTLALSLFFGQRHYMKRLVRLYSKTSIKFEGIPKYIDRNVSFDFFSQGKIYIGEKSVITNGVLILTHDYSIDCGLSSINMEDKKFESLFYKDVHIGKNSFIGQRAVILPGVCIGDNCIVGAGCVVSKNIPNDSIVVGNPCRIVKNTSEWAKTKMQSDEIKIGNKRIYYKQRGKI